MLRKRIIFSLIYNDGYFMQSRNFRLQRVGDINWLAKNYNFRKIAFSLDELIVINATRGEKNMQGFAATIEKLLDQVFIPVAAGGGIRTEADAELLFHSGADKLVLNSALHDQPELVQSLVRNYGSQSVVAAVDYKNKNGKQEVYIHDGADLIADPLDKWLQKIEAMHVGEIYLNSIDRDGTGFGYDLETIRSVAPDLRNPLIIAGGAGNEHHLMEGLHIDQVSAVATANLFNFIGNGIPLARQRMLNNGMNLVNWETVTEKL